MRSLTILLLTVLPLAGQQTDKEAALGAALADDTRRHTAAIDSPIVLDYVNGIGSRLAEQLPSRLNFTFAVVADPRGGSIHEPLWLPGGYVFVPAALFLDAVDESEFAAMLAHSVAHVAGHLGVRSTTQPANAGSVPLIFTGGWNTDDNLMLPAGFAEPWRECQLEADQTAVRLTAAAGFDPSALRRYLERTLPLDPDRAARLARLAQAPPRAAPPDGDFAAVQNEITRRLHRPPSLRTPPSLRNPTHRRGTPEPGGAILDR